MKHIQFHLYFKQQKVKHLMEIYDKKNFDRSFFSRPKSYHAKPALEMF